MTHNKLLNAVILLLMFIVFKFALGIATLILTAMVPFLKVLWCAISVIVWLGVGLEFARDFRYFVMWRF